ncbi:MULTISPECIES: hypothetical protein [unclassified Microcoleus]|uniref:hypothetical protein n=1 Tax=unclassified Microcoleus TaxID=2642155 RepID=UPI002FD6132E
MKRSYPVGNRTFGKTGKRPIAFVGKLETSDRISSVGWGRVYLDCLWVLKMVGEPAPTAIMPTLLTINYNL